MKFLLTTEKDLGNVIRAVRKDSGIRLDDLAGILDVSKQTTANVEQGKPTVALGTVMKHLKELGLTLTVDVPSSACKRLLALSTDDQDAVARIESAMAQRLPGAPWPTCRTSPSHSSSTPTDSPPAPSLKDLVSTAQNVSTPADGPLGQVTPEREKS